MRSRHVLLAGLAVSATLPGCADARGRFEDFEARRAQSSAAKSGEAGADSTGAAGAGGGGETGCMPPAPGVVQGFALMAMDTITLPGTALMFWGELMTPEHEGKTGVKYVYRPLDALDRRTEVGDQLALGPYTIADDGKFDFHTPLSTLDGRANAILPGVPITSELTLHGTICGVDTFYCGDVTGETTAPFEGPTSGHFGITLLASKDDIPERPRFGCAEDALAPKLMPAPQ
jgi:hypothetical protein